MPIYQFFCTKCQESWNTFFNMNANKQSKCPKCKKKGQRVFLKPNTSIDSKTDAWDIDKQVKKTGNFKGATVGNLWDMAAEMSEKRGGEHDPIRKKAEENYAKTRKGKKYRKPGGTVDISFNI